MYILIDFPGEAVVENLPTTAGEEGDVGSVPGSGRCPGRGNDSPLHSCLGNFIDRRALAGYYP